MKTKNIILSGLFLLSSIYMIIFHIFLSDYKELYFLLIYDYLYAFLAVPALIVSGTYLLINILNKYKYNKLIFILSLIPIFIYILAILPTLLTVIFGIDINNILPDSLGYYILSSDFVIFASIILGVSLTHSLKK